MSSSFEKNEQLRLVQVYDRTRIADDDGQWLCRTNSLAQDMSSMACCSVKSGR